jgi:predicted amidohydrolase
MITYAEFTLAAVQAAPVFYDREASTEKACRLIEEVARKGATLAAFGETWLPGHPLHERWSPLEARAAAEYLANAVEIPSPTTDRLCAAARRAGIDVIIGVVELDSRTRGTVYSTLLFIGCEGGILGRHRKLKPTAHERLVWGEGDAVGLKVYERPYARISGLNCWEHKMVLPGYALMAQGTQIHVAAWPGVSDRHTRQTILSRAFAIQAGCYVVAPCGLRSLEDVPERYRDLVRYDLPGGSCIIDPLGEVIAGPVEDKETVLTAQGSLEKVFEARYRGDVGGHYSRPDLLQLLVNRRPLTPVIESTLVNGTTGAGPEVPADRCGDATQPDNAVPADDV